MFRNILRFCKKQTRNKKTWCSTRNKQRTEFYLGQLAMDQRKKIKMLTTENSKLTVMVLGNGAVGSPNCLFVRTDHMNYMFNCGEGTQRIAQEYHCKLSKLDNVFITRPVWQNIGGLPGLSLTLKETGVSRLNVHCPDEVHGVMDSFKQLVFDQGMDINYPKIDELKPYKDHIMTVWYVPIIKSENNIKDVKSLDSIDENQCHSNENGKRPVDDTETEATSEKKRLRTDSDVICYICNVSPKRGKMNVKKCEEFGILPGPSRGILKSGFDVVTNNGRVVSHGDVCMKDGPKNTFMVIDCPSKEYLDSIVNHSAFSKYQTPSNEVRCIYHITPESIFNKRQYQEWIKKFPKETEHVILNSETISMGNQYVFNNQHVMHMIHPEIFPLLSEDSLRPEKETNKPNIYRGRTLQTLMLHPTLRKLYVSDTSMRPETHMSMLLQNRDIGPILEKLKEDIAKKSLELNLSNIDEFPQILMLGTGSSVPNKVRNTSAILLRINKDHSMLLDCGESTISQIIRFYGNTGAKDILRSIKAIFISHMHVDHHLGIIGILKEKEKYTQEPLYLLVPNLMNTWLEINDAKIEPILHLYNIVCNNDMYLKNHHLTAQEEQNMLDTINIKNIDTIYVKHCKFSFGISIVLHDETKIVYSGDTMPCDNLVNLGKNCDLLIHEATMGDGLEMEAQKKYHSTTSQAINAGELMNAKFILLTHFSQRYSKITQLPDGQDNVGIAYDNMLLKLPQLPLIPSFYPCLKILFQDCAQILKKREITKKKKAKIYKF